MGFHLGRLLELGMLFPEHMPKWGEYASGFGTKLTYVTKEEGGEWRLAG